MNNSQLWMVLFATAILTFTSIGLATAEGGVNEQWTFEAADVHKDEIDQFFLYQDKIFIEVSNESWNSPNAGLVVANPETGSISWTTSCGSGYCGFGSGPITTEELYLTIDGNVLEGYDLDTGNQISRHVFDQFDNIIVDQHPKNQDTVLIETQEGVFEARPESGVTQTIISSEENEKFLAFLAYDSNYIYTVRNRTVSKHRLDGSTVWQNTLDEAPRLGEEQRPQLRGTDGNTINAWYPTESAGFNANGTVYGLTRDSGNKLWSFDSVGGLWHGIVGTLVTEHPDDGSTIINTSRGEKIMQIGPDRWEAIVSSEHLIVANETQGFELRDLTTGNLIYQKNPSFPLDGTSWANNEIFAWGGGTIASYDDSTGTHRWSDTYDERDISDTINNNESWYIVHDDDAKLTAYEFSNGAEANTPPSASLSYSPNSPDVGETVSFDASASSDPDGSIASYSWDFDGDNVDEATGATVSHSFTSSGDTSVSLTVTDDDGASDAAVQTVSVSSDSSGGDGSPSVIDDFEDGDYDGWTGETFYPDDGSSDEQYVSVNTSFGANGSGASLEVRNQDGQVTGDDQGLQYNLSSAIQPAAVSFWFNAQDYSDQRGIWRIYDADQTEEGPVSGNNDQQLVELGHGLSFTPVDGRWYRYRLHNIDWQSSEADIRVTDASGTTVASQSDISLTIEEVAGVVVRNRLRGDAWLYLDEIQYTTRESSGVGQMPSLSASGTPGSPGGQATVSVTGSDLGSVTVSDVPSTWSVADSQNDGAFIAPDGQGDAVTSQGSVTWAWSTDQDSVDVSVSFDVPSTAQTGSSRTLTVEAEDGSGATDTTTTTIPIQDCPSAPAVCQYDTDGNGIETGELQSAIQAFLSNNLDTGGLQAVIQSFLSA